MSDLKIAVPGLDYQTELKITTVQRTGSTFTSLGANLAVITCTAAHGYSQTPTAPEAPVLFVKLSGTTSGLSGTGILVGNVFRVVMFGTGSNSITVNGTTTSLANTDIVIYTTVTAATVTSMTVQPAYFPVFQAALLSASANYSPQQAAGVTWPLYGSAQAVNFTTGSNTIAYYNPDNTLVPLDQSSGNTPTTAPTVRQFGAASSYGQLRFGPQDYFVQNAANATQTSYLSIVA